MHLTDECIVNLLAHEATITEIPEKYDTDIWIDIEAKEKEAAILKLYDVHPEIFRF